MAEQNLKLGLLGFQMRQIGVLSAILALISTNAFAQPLRVGNCYPIAQVRKLISDKVLAVERTEWAPHLNTGAQWTDTAKNPNGQSLNMTVSDLNSSFLKLTTTSGKNSTRDRLIKEKGLSLEQAEKSVADGLRLTVLWAQFNGLFYSKSAVLSDGSGKNFGLLSDYEDSSTEAREYCVKFYR